ncbi:MAG: serine/threonine protein kinase [Planctomycetes bacterium]|nr:serine/threonine protein kinase [Planctomycetota bacterium]
MNQRTRLRSRQRLGKYRIEKRLAEGGFAEVYQAYDSIEGIRVALKIPSISASDKASLETFRREVRLTVKLDHPHILSIKDASFIEGRFVIVYPLAKRSLSERLQSRMSVETVMDFAGQMLEALAYAHARGILHCDIKPDNVLIFDDRHLRLTDFGIARVARRTVKASGSGTLGAMAPEQAMGKPSQRSDVFAMGLLLYRMFTGKSPEWPFHWPLPGHEKLAARVSPSIIQLLRKSLEVEPRRRFRDATEMLEAFRSAAAEMEEHLDKQRRRRARAKKTRRKKAKTRSERRSR